MGLVLMAAAAWALFLGAISSALALGYPILRMALEQLHPGPRASALRAIVMAPAGIATLGVLLCFAPKLFGSVLSRDDHCLQHADGHPHFCLNHPPQVVFGPEVWMGLALIGLVLFATALIRGFRFRNSARILRQLASTARFDASRDVWMIDSDMPVAMSVGAWRTRTLLSSGLLRVIPARLVDAIVAHEHAHERRRDGLWKLATELSSFGYLPRTRRAMMFDLELACEQACDEEAGMALGDRTRVAEALLAMERVRQGMAGPGPAALAFGAQGFAARVASLVSDSPGRRGDRRLVAWLLLGAIAAATAGADPLHHLTETLIHHVLG